ncbi:fibrous sheath-interacting protein 2-like [Alligator mississippiensis]|uniref:Fibrous sheath-interacting protein 2-like n=1 Tax=Alligator mississippiensis TaxID=8496 RepID=A0A151NCU4_ALLMI|nr:fibrous sheath-interacting protein 2-like [Alligator mississippiensis]
MAKIIHSTLPDLLQESAFKDLVYVDMKSNKSVSAESLGILIRREITDYQPEEPLAKAPSSALSKPREPGEIDEKLLEDATKSNTQCKSPTPSTLEVCHRFSEDIITRLLSNILPATASPSSSTEKKIELAKLDLIHVKIISKVVAQISKDENSSSQHIEHLQAREDDMIQTIADSVYDKLLTQFQSKFNMQKWLRSGCIIISKALCDLVFKEISGNPLQNSPSRELPLHHCAEADSIVENTPRDVTEPLDNSISLSSELSKVVSVIIEKLAANLLSTFSSLLPVADLDAEKTLLLNDETRKILRALKVLLSRHEMNMNEHISEGEFEDSQAMGDLLPSACTSTVEHSDFDIFVGRDLTNRKDILAHRIAALIAKEAAKPEFQASSEEETLPTSSSTAKGVRIVENLILA